MGNDRENLTAWLFALGASAAVVLSIVFTLQMIKNDVPKKMQAKSLDDRDRHQPDEHHDDNKQHGSVSGWSYRGTSSPENWAKLDESYALCKEGKYQSPIDLVAKGAVAPHMQHPLEFHYSAAEVDWSNVGHFMRGTYSGKSYLRFEGKEYPLEHFDIHVPSEHRIAGKQFAAELQLFHKNELGEKVAVAILFRKTAENYDLNSLWRRLPKQANHPVKGIHYNLMDLIPSIDRSFYSYAGSMTTPPCKEGMTWFVMNQPIQISQSQVDELVTKVGTSQRPVQPLGKRAMFFTDLRQPPG